MSIAIPDPDNQLSRALEARAKQRGVSIEEEARQILQRALAAPDDLGAAIRNRFQPLGGVEINLPGPERAYVVNLVGKRDVRMPLVRHLSRKAWRWPYNTI